MTTNALTDILDGAVSELEICEPRWLYAGRLTDLETGASWRYVYRSPIVAPGTARHTRMMQWLDGATPVGEPQEQDDTKMMRGAGVLSIWES